MECTSGRIQTELSKKKQADLLKLKNNFDSDRIVPCVGLGSSNQSILVGF